MVTLSRALVVAVALTVSAATDPPLPAETYAGGFGDLRGIAVDDAGHVYVADHAAGTLVRIAADRTRRTIARGLDRPVGVALDASGEVLVAEAGAGRVVRLDARGTRTALVSDLEQPRWLAVADDGALYVSARGLARAAGRTPEDDSPDAQIVLVRDPAGAVRVLADGFRGVQGLALGHGALFVAARGGGRDTHGRGAVFRVPLDGGAPARWGPADDLEHPAGIARDRLGALFVAARRVTLGRDRARRAIAKVHPDGRLSRFAEDLAGPQGLAFDATGHLVVADGDRVLRFHAPAPPRLTAPAFTRRAAVTVWGTAEPDARVDLSVNAAALPGVVPDAGGRFAVLVPVVEEARNEIEAVATARRGDGLTSAAARATIVHDTLPSTLAFQAPPPGAHVRGSVSVLATATDATGVASLALTVDGDPLGAERPAAPVSPLAASAPWATGMVADGAHTLAAAATDAAGNVALASRVVVVDNTPPDTAITSGPPDSTAATSVTFAISGTDNLTPGASLEFAWRLDGGERSAFAAATSVTLSGLGPGAHSVEVTARDRAGNEDPTPAARAFTVATLRIAITAPQAGATVPAGRVLVRGTVEGGGAAVSASVNGFVAAVHEGAFAVHVPVAPGETVLTATARTPAGATASHSVAVTLSETIAAALRALPGDGLAPLDVQFALDGVTPATITLDADGDGAADFVGSSVTGRPFPYPTPGLYFPRATVTDDRGNQVVLTTLVSVTSPAAFEAQLGGLWTGFRARLRSGDVPGALEHLSPSIRPQFEDIFQSLAPALGAIAAGLPDIVPLDQADNLAEAALVSDDDGQPALYFIYFRRDGLGRWLIEEM